MPTPLNTLFHPYVREDEMARIMLYFRQFRFAARALIKRNARRSVLHRMRLAAQKYPYPIQVYNLNRGFNQGIVWRGRLTPVMRRTAVPRPDLYAPRLPFLTHIRKSIRGP